MRCQDPRLIYHPKSAIGRFRAVLFASSLDVAQHRLEQIENQAIFAEPLDGLEMPVIMLLNAGLISADESAYFVRVYVDRLREDVAEKDGVAVGLRGKMRVIEREHGVDRDLCLDAVFYDPPPSYYRLQDRFDARCAELFAERWRRIGAREAAAFAATSWECFHTAANRGVVEFERRWSKVAVSLDATETATRNGI